MFDRLAAEQLAFTIEDDAVIDLLGDWVALHAGEEVSTAQLFGALRTLATSSGRSQPFGLENTKSFGKYLRSNRATLNALFGATDRRAGQGKRLWRFNRPRLVEADIPTAVEVEAEIPTAVDSEREKEELRAAFEKMLPMRPTVQ